MAERYESVKVYTKPVEPTVVIELTLQEARTLVEVLGMGHSLTPLYDALRVYLDGEVW